MNREIAGTFHLGNTRLQTLCTLACSLGSIAVTPPCALPSANAVSLQDVVLADALTSRPSRAPSPAFENQALRQLIQQMAERPDLMVQKLVQLALEVCTAGSAGVSLLDI